MQVKNYISDHLEEVQTTRPESFSQYKAAALMKNMTSIENVTDMRKMTKSLREIERDEDPDDKNEKDHTNYGHVDDTKKKFPPRFKHPSKLFNMDMKPAGSSIRLRCAAEGKDNVVITTRITFLVLL